MSGLETIQRHVSKSASSRIALTEFESSKEYQEKSAIVHYDKAVENASLKEKQEKDNWQVRATWASFVFNLYFYAIHIPYEN